MPSLFKCVLFAANAIFSGIGVSFATLFGQWQLTLLFSDWIELQYVQILGGDWQPQRVLHGLPHMANRALWVDYAESTGIPTPLLYYAASYSLIPLDASEEVSTLSSTVMMLNNWTSGWVQSRSVADYFCELLEGRRFMTHVGAFDMVDDGANLPALPERALAVFDVEPNVSATQLALAGYIISYLDEDVCVAFWQTLAAAARQHNLVLIHKPKRPMPSSKARKYDKLLKALKEEGIYYPLQPSTGACRLLQATAASIIQPFTSVADLAEDLNTNTAFLNPSGVIPNAQNYARQASVIDTKQQLDEFLSKHFPLN